MPPARTSEQQLRHAVAAACAPLGIRPSDVTVTAARVSVPSAGLSVAAELSAGVRVWRAVRTLSVRSADGGEERRMTQVLFEEPFEQEWRLARRIAMHVAETRIDAAIDAAAGA